MQWTSVHRPAPQARWAAWLMGGWVAWLLLCAAVSPALAQGLAPATPAATALANELTSFEVTRGDDGLTLGFAVQFELPRGVEDALQKGVPLYFVAQATLYRDRWYWRDRRINTAERTWRLAFQPLTRKYRVSFGGLNQNYDSLADALVAVRRVSGWKIAEPGALEEGSRHYIEFSYRLDTSLMPRPLQIGLGGQADWALRIEKFHRIE